MRDSVVELAELHCELSERQAGGMASQGGTAKSSTPAPLSTKTALGAALRRLRRTHGLSMREMVAPLNLSAHSAIAEYEAGRRIPASDILAAYERHFGLPPGTLLALRAQALAARADSETAPFAATGGNQPIPRTLPSPPRHFTGRTRQLKDVTEFLSPAHHAAKSARICVIHGIAGVGKTSLAVTAGRELADQFPDGQLYINLRGFDPAAVPTGPIEALETLVAAVAHPTATPTVPVRLETLAAHFRSLLSGRRVLIVLDNARDSDQVRPLLPGDPSCAVIVTSRNALTGLVAAEGALPLALGTLAELDALDLLTRLAGIRRLQVQGEPGLAVIRLCAGLPLALCIAAARIAAQPALSMNALAAQLQAEHSRLDALDIGDSTTDVRAAFSWSYKNLSAFDARAFRLLALHPALAVTTEAAASLLMADPAETEQALHRLTQAGLLTEPRAGRFALHDLLRAYAAELVRETDRAEHRSAATERLLHHYVQVARTASQLINPGRESAEPFPPLPGVAQQTLADFADAQRWYEEEKAAILALTKLATRDGFHLLACRLAQSAATFFDWRGDWNAYAASQESALTAARHLKDPAEQARAHRLLGRARAWLGEHTSARKHLQEALQLYRETGDRPGTAHAHFSLALVLEKEKNPELALEHAQEALESYHAVRHDAGEAAALNAVGWFNCQLGRYQHALESCRTALTAHQRLKNPSGESDAWDSLGHAHHGLGQYARALDCYQQALALRRKLGTRYAEASTLTRLGDVHHDLGDDTLARRHWQSAIDILDDLHHPDAEEARAKLAETEIAG